MEHKVRKMFFAWNIDKEKEFLEEMALKGYRLVKVKFGAYIFEKDEPKKLMYQIDFRGLDRMSEEKYLHTYKNAGCDFIDRFGAWYYFACECNEEKDLSIFNSNEAKSAMYKRLLLFLCLIGFPFYSQAFVIFPNMSDSKFEFPSFYFFFRIALLLLVGIHLFTVVKILYSYRKLKK